jgi:hypothetical protein
MLQHVVLVAADLLLTKASVHAARIAEIMIAHMFVPCCFADLCEVESDPTPLRWRVAKVMHRAFGVDPAGLPLETRFMVRHT